eukprot:4295608-Amphidinium_carterae.1
MAANGIMVREAFGVCPLELCPQQTAPEEDYALYMLGQLCDPQSLKELRVGSDCHNTVRAAMRAPRSHWHRRARSTIWRGIWALIPAGVEVFQTKAHRCEAQLGEDAFGEAVLCG